MQIVIDIHDIPKNDHERWVLANGTPLPEGHGRLIDADSIKDRLEEEKVKLDSLDIDYGLKRACLGKLIYEVQSSPTIIETEKAHEGGTQYERL